MSEITIDPWYGKRQSFGQLGHPQRQINILGTISPKARVARAYHRINGGAELPLHLGPDKLRLHGDGDFNAEIDRALLRAGENQVEIIAYPDEGVPARSVVVIDYSPATRWPLPYELDCRALDPVTLQQKVQVVDGRWSCEPDGLRTADPWYDRLLAVGDVTWTDYRLRVTATLHRWLQDEPGRLGGGLGLLYRWSGHRADAHQPSREWRPNGAIAWHRATWDHPPATYRNLNISDAVVKDVAIVQTDPCLLDLGRAYVYDFAIRSRPGQTGHYRFRCHPADAPDQLLCDLQCHAVAGEATSGSVLLIALYVDVTIHYIAAEPA